MEEKALIEVKELSKKYGEKRALNGLSFRFDGAGVYVILGPAGAGKTTLLDIISGCCSADGGEVLLNDINVLETRDKAKKKISYLPEMHPLYEDMTPYEYLVFVGELKKIPYEKLYRNVKSAIELVGIEERSNILIANLPAGVRRRVGIAQAVLGNPDLILLDEPLLSLEGRQLEDMRELIRKLGELKTVVVCASELSTIRDICDRLLIISHGEAIACDTVDNLERRLECTNALLVSVRGVEDKIVGVIETLEGFVDCIILGKDGEGISMKLECRSGVDIRDELSLRLAEAGCPILAMERTTLTLDDVYLKLVDSRSDDTCAEGGEDNK